MALAGDNLMKYFRGCQALPLDAGIHRQNSAVYAISPSWPICKTYAETKRLFTFKK